MTWQYDTIMQYGVSWEVQIPIAILRGRVTSSSRLGFYVQESPTP